MSNPLRSLLEEPRPSAPPVRVWRDWALLAVVTVTGVLEGVLREDLPLVGLSVVLTVGLAPLLLWRLPTRSQWSPPPSAWSLSSTSG